MKPFKRTAQQNGKRLNALGMAGALGGGAGGGGGGTESGGEEDHSLVDEDGTRAQRFATDLEGNRFRELEAARVEERKRAIKLGLISDPDRPTSLSEAIEFRGTCTDMCPVYEQQEREFKKNVHPLEMREGAGQAGRIDPRKAVTMYHRSAAGIDQPLPSDVRDPATLKRTLDHLFHHVLLTPAPPNPDLHPPLPPPLASLKHTHHFLRDRTRGIRQDFTYQRHWGVKENIECHERIARFHILSMYELGGLEGGHFLKQEAEQLNKTLISLIELYEDQRLDGHESLNEPEFRGYQLLSHLHDQEVARSILSLPSKIFHHPLVQLAFDLRALAQRNFDTQKVGSKSNAEISLNHFTRYFKRIKSADVPFLVACLAHNKLGEVRRAGTRALMRSYARVQPSALGTAGMKTKVMTTGMFKDLMGCTNETEAIGLALVLDITPVWEDGTIEGGQGTPMGFLISAGADYNDNADAPPSEKWVEIEHKGRGASYQDIIDGKVSTVKAPLGASAPPFNPRVEIRGSEEGVNKVNGSRREERRPEIERSSGPHVGVGMAPPRQSIPGLVQPPSFSFGGTLGAGASMIAKKPSGSSFGGVEEKASVQPAGAPPATGPDLFAPALKAVPISPPRTQEPILPMMSTPVTNAVSSSSTIRPRKVTPPAASTQPSSAQVESVARSLASQMLFEVVKAQVDATTTETLKSERKRRLIEARDKEHKRADHASQTLTNNMLDDVLRQVSGQIAAEAFLVERRRIEILHETFTNWVTKAMLKRKRREVKESKRRIFAQGIESMKLGASRVNGVDLEDALDKSLSRSVRKRGRVSLDLDMHHLEVGDTVAVLEKRSKQKAIFEEGTYFSLLGNHVCNMESDLDMLEERKHGVQELGEWHVIIDATEEAGGRWLKSKFNLLEEGRYEARFAGSLREGKIVALANTEAEEDWTEDVGLVILECGSDPSSVEERYQAIKQKVPPRRRFQIGLLLVTWKPEEVAALPKALNILNGPSPFAWHHTICLAKDASDKAFDESLFIALPEITTVPIMTFSTDGILKAMTPHWKGIRAIASAFLNRQKLDLDLIAHVVQALLRILAKMQNLVVLDVLGLLDVNVDDIEIADFAREDVSTGLEYPSQLRSELEKLVPQHEALPSLVKEAMETWRLTEDLEDHPIESAMNLVDLLSESVYAHMSQLDICIPETEVDDADLIGEHAVEDFKADVERVREEIARLAKIEKVTEARKKSAVTAPEPPIAKSSTPLQRLQAALTSSQPELAAAAPLLEEHMSTAILQHTYSYQSPSLGRKRLASTTPDDEQTDKKAKLRRLLAAANVAMTTV